MWMGWASLEKAVGLPSRTTPCREAGQQREGLDVARIFLALFSWTRLLKYMPANSEIPNSRQNKWAPKPRSIPGVSSVRAGSCHQVAPRGGRQAGGRPSWVAVFTL